MNPYQLSTAESTEIRRETARAYEIDFISDKRKSTKYVRNFVDKLDPKWKEVWKKTDRWQQRKPVPFAPTNDQPYPTSSAFGTLVRLITPSEPSENVGNIVNRYGTTTYTGG